MKDGPNKTILGTKQKAKLKKTIAESDASFKFIVTPGPIVGPDKPKKKDNHSNPGFFHEGEELRKFIASQRTSMLFAEIVTGSMPPYIQNMEFVNLAVVPSMVNISSVVPLKWIQNGMNSSIIAVVFSTLRFLEKQVLLKPF